MISNIPNILHFVFGLKEQEDEFLFCYYLAIYSASKYNNPEKIYFYYHFMPHGKWWNEALQIPNLVLEKVDIPTNIGDKPIKFLAHKADKVRMNKLYERGGVYLDIDTISLKSYEHLLENQVVLGLQKPYVGICNAVMFTKPKTEFFKIWLDNYNESFKTNGWNESSIDLPYKLSKEYPNLLTVVDEDYFFTPSYNETNKIFYTDNDIPEKLVALHLWEKMSIKYIKQINGWEWAKSNSQTLYGKIMLKIENDFN